MQAATLALAMTMLFLTPAELLGQTYTALYSFQGNADGANPNSGVTADAGGNFYGTASYGGSSQSQMCNHRGGCGLQYLNGNWTYRSLHDFGPSYQDAFYPWSNVTVGSDGKLYGTTANGGTGQNCPSGFNYHCGVIWQITP